MITAAELAKNLGARRSGDGWVALCPAHDDKKPSLSIGEGVDGKLLLYCFAGCSFEEIRRSLDLATPSGKKGAIVKSQLVNKFEYHDTDGKLLYIKERWEPGFEGESKSFLFRQGGKLGRRCIPVLYNLPALGTADTIYIVEGEAKADHLNSWSLTATCLDSGASSYWHYLHAEILAGKNVVILPDNDDPGWRYAEKAALALGEKVKSLKVILLPGLPEKGDILDWVRQKGNDKTRLLKIVKAAPEGMPTTETTGATLLANLRPMSDIELYKRPVPDNPALLESLIFEGRLHILSAYMKVGKSEFLAQLILAILRGVEFIGFKTKKARVLLLSEMAETDLLRTFKRLSHEPTGDFYIQGREAGPFLLDYKGVEAVEEFVRGHSIGLVVVDVISRFWSVEDENSATEVEKGLKPLLGLCGSTGAAILLSHHETKSGGEHGRGIRGSGAIFGAVDQALMLERHGEETQRRLRVIGRYAESPDKVLLDFIEGQYIALELGGMLHVPSFEIRNALGDEPMDVKAIEEKTRLSRSRIYRTLSMLKSTGEIEVIPRKGRGGGFLYKPSKKMKKY